MSFIDDFVVKMRPALINFHQEVGAFIQSNKSIPIAGSQALTEQAAYQRPESVLTAYSLGVTLIEYGGEHLTAFVKTITDPMEVIACWTCVRSMLESCALSAWLLDPSIDAHTRVGRGFALRYEGMEQQLKYGRATGQPAAEITSAEDHLNQTEQIAISLGFAPVVNRNNDRIGIAQDMPSATEMIKLMLDEENMYRLLSGVAHGHHWAINQLSYQASTSGPTNIGGVAAVPFEKTTDMKGIALLGLTAFKALARPLWNHCQYFGYDKLKLEEILETNADAIEMRETTRFWRP